jgi:hypothetical protein
MKDTIILLLSQHRQPANSSLPLALTISQITSLLKSAIAPDRNLNTETLRQDLNELEAMGEILAGDRNQYCIAPPTLLALDEENLTSLLFTGDRTYLALAHKALDSEPTNRHDLRVSPKVHRLAWIKSRLDQVGVRLWTVADSLKSLPIPQKPDQVVLRSHLSRNPFENDNWRTDQNILQYIPRANLSLQTARWQPANYAQILTKNLSPLIRLPTGEYIWIDGTEFYEIEPDVAMLTMFALDIEANANLKIIWDEPQGRLNLQGISLPSDYARWLWRISEPVDDIYRTRYFEPLKRPLITESFNKLGCELV